MAPGGDQTRGIGRPEQGRSSVGRVHTLCPRFVATAGGSTFDPAREPGDRAEDGRALVVSLRNVRVGIEP